MFSAFTALVIIMTILATLLQLSQLSWLHNVDLVYLSQNCKFFIIGFAIFLFKSFETVTYRLLLKFGDFSFEVAQTHTYCVIKYTYHI